MNIIILGTLFGGLFALSEYLYYKKGLKVETTRKMVHLVTGLLTLLFPFCLNSMGAVVSLCSIFLIILIASKKWHFLESVNGVDRQTLGSYLYPIIVIICFGFYQYFDTLAVYFTPILVLAISDPLAALAGKKWPFLPYKIGQAHKTSMGTSIFLLSAWVVTFCCLTYLSPHVENIYLITFCVAMGSSILEAISANGWDNLTIPLGTLAILVAFI